MLRDQFFYGHGKLLLSGEYAVLDGALSLGLPTTVGQSLKVSYKQSYQPTLNWKSIDHTGKLWFESDFEFWHFKPIKKNNVEVQQYLSRVLKQVRLQNPHFLRDDLDVFVETKLGFPIEWGLGSSSTLLYNVAQWAYVSPFELVFKTLGGSGYDVACAQSMGPILYQLKEGKPEWTAVNFNPSFKENLYFVYLGKKQNSYKSVQDYRGLEINRMKLVAQITELTKAMIQTQDLKTFGEIIHAHEQVMSEALGLTPVKDYVFLDYWGEVKSLGAWGGDFVLVTSHRSYEETRDYFFQKGLTTFIPFSEIVLTENRIIEKGK